MVYVFDKALVVGLPYLKGIYFPLNCSWMTPHTHVVIVVRGLTSIYICFRGSYLLCSWSMAWHGYRSWQYMTSMNFVVRNGIEVSGTCVYEQLV